MTDTFDNYYLKSLLSKAAYSPNSLSKGANAFNGISGLAASQIELLNDTYEVVSTKVDSSSGFEAVVFKNKKTGEITMVVAGTDASTIEDLANDTTILTNGLAIEQFMQAFNYYQEISSNSNEVYKITLKSYDTPPSIGCYTKVVLDTDGSIKYLTYEYTLSENTLPVSERGQSNIDFAGHSLGGHLAGLLSMVTGAEATIFNAPGYKECVSNFQEVVGFSEGGAPILKDIGSDIDLLVNHLAGGTVGTGNVKHICNDTGSETISNYGIDWIPTIDIDGLSTSLNPFEQHGIDNICNTLYAYETLKEFTNGYEAFFIKNDLTTSKEVFENAYKAYCLYFNNSYRELDYGNSAFIQSLTSSFKLWADSIKDAGGVLMVDSFNKTASLPLGGSGGNDIIYTGGGNDSVNAGGGNDTVYGGDFFNNAATNDYTKDINLGSGNDTYYGGDGKDIVRSSSGENTVRLAGGDDQYVGGSDVDKVFGGSGNNEIRLGRDKVSDVYFSNVINGEVDVVWNSSKDDYIILAGGVREQETKGNDLYIYGKNGGTIILKERGEEETPVYGDDEDISFLQKLGIDIREIANNGKTNAERQASPLVLDLDGDGVETSGLESGVFFDHDGNGFAENSGWVGRDDVLLVRDINGNGLIDDGTELFGNNSVLSSGYKAKNGFEALKDLDINNDGIFNNQDTAWNEVKVWKDLNTNGILEEGELLSLESVNVSGINLGYANSTDVDSGGNSHLQKGSFIKTDGSTGSVNDVWFDVDKSNTIYDKVVVSDDIKALPNLNGFGNVVSLHEAMVLDTTGELKNLVDQRKYD